MELDAKAKARTAVLNEEIVPSITPTFCIGENKDTRERR
jgi:hypothetical protein